MSFEKLVYETRKRYLAETALALRNAGFQVEAQPDDKLLVKQGEAPLCVVENPGGISYRTGDMVNSEIRKAKDDAYDIVRQVFEYVKQMDCAPTLSVSDLHDRYKVLADFNGTVLAGMESKYGVMFVTWDWDFDRKGLSHGHYYEGNYQGAKQDFATRSGLIDKHHLFSDEQLAEVYRCVHETLESHYPMTVEREKLLKAVAEQIEYGVPSLDELVEQSNLKEMEVESSVPYQEMTQQF